MADQKRTLWTLVGLAAGGVTGVWLWRRGSARDARPADGALKTTGDGDPAERLSRALAADVELRDRGVSVHAISTGVVEVTGVVADRDQRERVVAMAHNTDGIHTVVNRLVPEDEEVRVRSRRARRDEPPLQHSGMGVGMGTRRQSPDTDPDRPSDRQKLVDRELDVENMEADALEEMESGSPESSESATSPVAPEPDQEEREP